MNRDKIVSSAVFVLIAAIGIVGVAYGREAEDTKTLPKVTAVLPDVIPLDTSDAPSIAPPFKIQTTAMVTIYGSAPKSPGRVWTCSLPRPLENDATATVRECEYR